MENSEGKITEEMRIQGLLNAYLTSRNTLKSSAAETSFHLDDDSLTAFAEGVLNQRESGPVVGHLVDCGFCRHKTAELVRLSLEFSDVDHAIVPLKASEPSGITEVLSGLLAKIFGSTEGAVFAHDEKEPEKDADKESGKGND